MPVVLQAEKEKDNINGRTSISVQDHQDESTLNSIFLSETDSDGILETIKKLIHDNTVLVFSKTWCPFCIELKRSLNELSIPFGLIELDALKNGSLIQKELTKLNGQKTVPHIYINGNHIGGCNQFKSYVQNGKLDSLIHEFRDQTKEIKEIERELYYNNNPVSESDEAIQCLFSFPSTVNNNTVRVLGIMSFIICIFGLIFRNYIEMKWSIFGLFIDFLIRFVSGASMSPLGILANIIVSQITPDYSPGAPKQFASLCGVIFSLSTFLCLIYDEIVGGCIILSVLLICACLEGFGNFCVGCLFFGYLVRFNIIPKSVYKLHLNTKDEKELIYKEAFTKLNEGPYEIKQRFVDDNNPRKCDLYYKIKTDEQKQEDFHIIRHIKISLFNLILGINALAVLWRIIADINIEPFTYITYDVSDVLFLIALISFFLISLLYLFKILFYPKKVFKEFQCPLNINLFATIPINIMCFCYLLLNRDFVSDDVIKSFFWISAILNMLLLIYVTQTWFTRRIGLEQMDPAFMMIPLTNFIAVFVGISIDTEFSEELWLWFSSALILFFILFPLTFYKIIMDSNSDDRRRNNLLIWCASPGVAGLAAELLFDSPASSNLFSLFMYFCSIFMSLIIFNLMIQKFIGRTKFDSSYYSFGFSLAVVAIISIKIFIIYRSTLYEIICYIFISIACLAVAVNILHFIFGLSQKRVFRPMIPKWGVLSFMRLTHEAFHGWIKKMDILLDQDNININKIRAEWNIMVIIHKEHAKHEDNVIFKEANTLFPGFTDCADVEHEEHDKIMNQITELFDKKDSKNDEIIKEIKKFLNLLKAHLLWEEANVQPIMKKYIPIQLQKQILEKVWYTTHYSKWSILIPWILRNQPKLPQRILFLKTLLWSMPYRCQMIGLLVYRGCNDVLWADISQEIPEIIPRGLNGWKRQY